MSREPEISLADVARAVGALAPSREDFVAIAALLGFAPREVAPAITAPVRPQQPVTAARPPRESAPQEAAPPQVDPAASLASTITPVDESTDQAPWRAAPILAEDAARVSPPFESLFNPPWSRSIVPALPEVSARDGEIDAEALVARIARGTLVTEVPRRLRRALRADAHVLLDASASMLAFALDVRDLRSRLERLAGHSLVFASFRGCPARGVQRDFDVAPYQPPAKGTPVLLVSDLGLGARTPMESPAGVNEWVGFFRAMSQAECPVTVLMPGRVRRLPRALGRLAVVAWDRRDDHAARAGGATAQRRSGAVSLVARLRPELREFAAALSLAATVDHALVRRMRLALFPRLDARAEAELWSSDVVRARDHESIEFAAAALEPLRAMLVAAGSERLEAARRVVERAHANAPRVTRLEEEVIYRALRGGRPEELDDVLKGALATLVSQSGSGMARWAARAMPRLPRAATESAATWALALGASARLGTASGLGGSPPPEAMKWLVGALPRSTTALEVGVRLTAAGIELSVPAGDGSHRIRVPDTTPAVVEVACREQGAWRAQAVVLARGKVTPVGVIGSPVRLRNAWGETFEVAAVAEAAGGEASAGDGLAAGASVFVSYPSGRKDRHEFERFLADLRGALAAHGIAVIDGSTRSKTGSDWQRERDHAISSAAAFIYLLYDYSNEDRDDDIQLFLESRRPQIAFDDLPEPTLMPLAWTRRASIPDLLQQHQAVYPLRLRGVTAPRGIPTDTGLSELMPRSRARPLDESPEARADQGPYPDIITGLAELIVSTIRRAAEQGGASPPEPPRDAPRVRAATPGQPTSLNPEDLAVWQLALDEQIVASRPHLLARRRDRMLASPLSFVRMAARLFYEVVRLTPTIEQGPEGWVFGNPTLASLGIYRSTRGHLTIGFIDHAEIAFGRTRLDLVYLVTSALVQRQAYSERAAQDILRGYAEPGGQFPRAFEALQTRNERRSQDEVLDVRASTSVESGRRQLKRGGRYEDLQGAEEGLIPDLLRYYVDALGSDAPDDARRWTILDAANHIAGSASLGQRRYAVLVRGEDEHILDFSELGVAAADVRSTAADATARFTEGYRALVNAPQRGLAAAGSAFIGREPDAGDDRLDWEALSDVEDQRSVAEFAGALLARAHRSAGTPVERPDESILRDALEIAHVLEGTRAFLRSAVSR